MMSQYLDAGRRDDRGLTRTRPKFPLLPIV